MKNFKRSMDFYMLDINKNGIIGRITYFLIILIIRELFILYRKIINFYRYIFSKCSVDNTSIIKLICEKFLKAILVLGISFLSYIIHTRTLPFFEKDLN